MPHLPEALATRFAHFRKLSRTTRRRTPLDTARNDPDATFHGHGTALPSRATVTDGPQCAVPSTTECHALRQSTLTMVNAHLLQPATTAALSLDAGRTQCSRARNQVLALTLNTQLTTPAHHHQSPHAKQQSTRYHQGLSQYARLLPHDQTRQRSSCHIHIQSTIRRSVSLVAPHSPTTPRSLDRMATHTTGNTNTCSPKPPTKCLTPDANPNAR